MKQLKIELENCYGIKKMQFQFDFSSKRAYAIYAPNGSMKSSLAQTFQDIIDGNLSKDRIFPSRVTKRSITDESSVDLSKETVLVVRPYDEVLGHTEKTSTLLVNPVLRKEYEDLHIAIDAAKDLFMKALRDQAGSKRDIEREISSTFTPGDDQFYRPLVHRPAE
jgi:hypothetical protein